MMDRERREWDRAMLERATDPEARREERRGYFVDEIYVEDEEEAMERADDEALRAARMLGFGILLLVFGAFLAAAWILWRAFELAARWMGS